MTNIILPEVYDEARRWETYQRYAHRDKGGQWVAGFGHTSAAGPPEVTDKTEFTEDEAREIFHIDMGKAALYVSNYLRDAGITLNDHQFGACVDVAFNRGSGTFRASEVFWHLQHPAEKFPFRKVPKAFVICTLLVNPDTHESFPRLNFAWDDALQTTREYDGLTNRRIRNAAMFLEQA
jgi:GH24 family phage-related lysozyme (muramidase)